MSELFIDKIIEILKDRKKVELNNNDPIKIFNNTEILFWIIENYRCWFDSLLFLLEISTIKNVLDKYIYLDRVIFEYFKDDEENLYKIFTDDYFSIDIMNLSIINNKNLLLVKCLSSGIKPNIETYQLLIEYDLLHLINKNDINYHDICKHLIEQQDKESLVLPIIFLSLKNEDIPKVFDEALSWGRLKIIRFMINYYDELTIDTTKLDNSYVLNNLHLIYSC